LSIGVSIAIVAVLALIAAGWWFLHLNMRGKPAPLSLKKGDPLPAFSAEKEDGNPLHSKDLLGKPAVLLFVRGNWCPFCTRQVADLAKHYQQINKLGANLVFVTPKPLDTTRRVADMFGVEFEFWLDKDLSVARMLGLVHKAGVPGKHRNTHGQDTIWPTAIVCDADGIIRHASQSLRIVDRPDPAVLLSELKKVV